jgi:hypothetical protein
MLLSACGLKCDECEFFNTTCQGCYNVKGSTFWAREMMPEKVCPLYDCSVNKNGLHSCGGCNKLPCELFLNMKDPDSTEEEHRKSIITRVELLKSN